jgi:hypothetical protein
VLESCEEVEDRGRHAERAPIRMSWDAWQRLLNLEMQLATYLRSIAEPR